MSIEKMKLVQITGNLGDFDRVLRRCSATGMFHPEQVPRPESRSAPPRTEEQANPFRVRLNRILDIAAISGLDVKGIKGKVNKIHGEAFDGFLDEFQRRLLELGDEKRRLQAQAEQSESALQQLVHLDTLDVSLDEIFACRYVKVRFGRLPTDNYQKLSYYGDRLFLCVSLSGDESYQWCVYFTTQEHEAEVDDIFSSLYFERVWIPEFVHGTPGSAEKLIQQQLEEAKKSIQQVNRALKELVQQNQKQFLEVYAKIKFLCEAYDLRKYVVVYDELFSDIEFTPARITGFIAARDEARFKKAFADIEDIVLEIQQPETDERLVVPTKLRNNWFAQPFQMFVEMYGTPGYHEMDPTPFLAVTYTLLFGIMFGDVGQGLVIALLGLFLWKTRSMNFGRILTRIGVSAACFGALYGSVFGMEHLLDPLYQSLFGLPEKPVDVMNPVTINTLLIAAVGIGVALLLVSMSFNIAVGLKNRDYEKAVFGNNGLAGLVFYLAVLAGVLGMLTGHSLFSLPYVLGLIVLPLAAIFLKGPLGRLAAGHKPELEGGIGGFILESFFELFEVVLSFATNTISFLRVGGFIISHAGMMAVVLTLTEMMNGAGSVAVMIVGNLFVMALEGFIVGIQALRLQFYEMFSHYFSGQGKAFTPVVAGVPDPGPVR